MELAARSWAQGEFGGAKFGDARRTQRFVEMMGVTASRPGGRVTQVFDIGAQRQAAYDFLEHRSVRAESVLDAVANAGVRACAGLETVLVALDGTSLGLTERLLNKGFGSVGARKMGGRGLKVMSALAMNEQGHPLGVPTQRYWARGERVPDGGYRGTRERESAHWRHAVDEVGERFARLAPASQLHFVCDREADAALMMRHIIDAGHDFTIRANGTRKVLRGRGRVGIRSSMRRTAPLTDVWLHIPARAGLAPREARLSLRIAQVSLVLRDHHVHDRGVREVAIVWACERGRPPAGYARVEWMLYTTLPVTSPQSAYETLERYSFRWRIEEFHRTWKSGACNVETTQLRTREATIKWACMLAAVAARVEQLKHLSRSQPELPASVALSDVEIQTLIALKRARKKRNEVVPDSMPTIEMAVRWFADIGGYVANKGNGPPGSTIIARGLERVSWGVEALKAAEKLR